MGDLADLYKVLGPFTLPGFSPPFQVSTSRWYAYAGWCLTHCVNFRSIALQRGSILLEPGFSDRQRLVTAHGTIQLWVPHPDAHRLSYRSEGLQQEHIKYLDLFLPKGRRFVQNAPSTRNGPSFLDVKRSREAEVDKSCTRSFLMRRALRLNTLGVLWFD